MNTPRLVSEAHVEGQDKTPHCLVGLKGRSGTARLCQIGNGSFSLWSLNVAINEPMRIMWKEWRPAQWTSVPRGPQGGEPEGLHPTTMRRPGGEQGETRGRAGGDQGESRGLHPTTMRRPGGEQGETRGRAGGDQGESRGLHPTTMWRPGGEPGGFTPPP
ncbi:unnamed protein product [Arctogadus glacialis]